MELLNRFLIVSDMEVDGKVNSYLIQCQMWKWTVG